MKNHILSWWHEIKIRTMFKLIRYFADTELDQFENYRIETIHGPLFVTFARKVPNPREQPHGPYIYLKL